ncbi:aminotransferase class V-fold PLP-dependent enzyme [Sphingobacterium bambusae]|uniref:Aminotransferase class V-fold PLP-dependent enzyme n=1 Tax=Sphingobacterium bambusae TaxID=662858 RepID=A0ABW6BD10_9SPHI|nr:aminotransferase class V-fold PLP-dependent enzyme [Sphingobacterium bambusae]WPL48635.1 aminotransferase class V-fold PLP-dependent enzyme [Sphingobacterium bambusae]
MQRREVLKLVSAASIIGGVFGPKQLAHAIDTAPTSAAARNLFQELGIRTFINARGTITAMSGSLMHQEVLDAIQHGAQAFCMLDEVQDKVGERIAKLVHAESAVVTSGAFAALTLGLAGVLTGMDEKKVGQLPHLAGTGMKTEVICQKSHEIVYNKALTNTGCKMIMIETMDELKNAISDKTALMFFLNIEADKGQISHEQWVEVGKQYGIPTMIDIAADVPPVSNLWKFNDMGFDLVCISGGKAMRGPQSAGILMGRKNIIQAARLSMPPRGFTIGRGMKVNKEEVLGMYVALEKFVKQDHAAEWKSWEARTDKVKKKVEAVAGIKTRLFVPKLGNITPNLEISWDPKTINITGDALAERLRKGSPSIELGEAKEHMVSLTVWMMKVGEEDIVATKLVEELNKAKV